MKKNYTSIVTLAVTLGAALGACVVVGAFAPMSVLPGFTVPNMAAVCLVALLAAHYIAGAVCYDVLTLVLGVVTFGLLSGCSGLVAWNGLWKTALIGGAVFYGLSFLFAQMESRLQTGPAAKAAPILSALGLYLAMQCF